MTIQEQIKQNAQKQRAEAAAKKKKEEEQKKSQQTQKTQQTAKPQQTQKQQSRPINPNNRSMREVIDELARGRRQMARETNGNMRGTLGTIQAINEVDPNKADKLYSWLERRSADKSSRYYDAYKNPTNSAVSRLSGYGVDTSKVDDDWYKQNAWLKNHYNTSDYTNNPVKPGKRATNEEKAAYEYYQMMLAEEQTKKAEKEQAELENYLRQEATRQDRTMTDREIVEGINWNKFPTLKKMREGAQIGAPIELNRAVSGSSDDFAYATLWRALNPDNKGSYEADLINSSMGYGNTFERQQEAKRQKEQQDQAVMANTQMWRDATAHATYGPGGQNDAWKVYAQKSMYDSMGAEGYRDYVRGIESNANTYMTQKYPQMELQAEKAYKRNEQKQITKEQLSDMSLASFENYAAEYKRRAGNNPAMQKSDKELFRDWANQVYNEREKGTWDNGDDPLMMSDDGLRNYQIRLGKQIADIQGTIDEIDRQREERAAWYPDNAMQDWNDLHASMAEGEYTGGVSIADILSEYGIDPSAEEIQRRARDYYNNQFKTMRPGDTEEQRALNREILFDSVYGTGSGDGLYEMVTENMTDEERAMFDEKLDYIIEDMQNPYEDDDAMAAQIQQAEQQIADLKGKRDSATMEAEQRAKQIALEQKAAGMTLDESKLPTERNNVPEGNNQLQRLLNARKGPQGDRADKVFWAIQDAQSKWNMMSTTEKMDMLENLGSMRSGLGESLQNTLDTYNQYYMFMTPEMVDVFNTFYSNGDKESALAYVDALGNYLRSARNIMVEKVERENARGKYGAIYGGFSILNKPLAGLTGTTGAILAGLGNKDAQDKSSELYLPMRGIQAVQDERGNVWDDALVKTFGDDWKGMGKFLNGVAYSMADNILAMATTAGIGSMARFDMSSKMAEGLIQLIMSSEATASSMIEQLDAGKDPTEAAIMAIGGGIIEALTEKYSIENLLQSNVKDMIGNPMQLLKHIGKQWFTEGTEEVASDWLNMILDEAMARFKGHESELTQQAQELKAANPNMPDEEVNRQVLWGFIQKNIQSFAAGSLSGMLMGAGQVGLNTAAQSRMGANISSKNNITEEGLTGAEQLVQAASKMKEGTQSRKIAEEILSMNGKPGNRQLGQLAQNILYESSEEIGNIARNTVVQEAKAQLIGKGMGDRAADSAAQVIAKAATEGMESLTNDEMSTLADDQAAIDLLKEFTSDPKTAMGIRMKQIADTAEQRSIRQQVEELVTGAGRQNTSASARDVADSLENANIATQEDIDAAEGEITGDAGEVVYNNKIGKITKIEQGKAVLTTNGTTETVDLSELKAVNPTAAAVITMAQTKGYLMSDRYASKVLQHIGDNAKTEAGRYLDDAMKIRLRAYGWNTMPRTSLDSRTAQELYNEAIAERDEAEQARVAGATPTLEPGKGVVTYDGAEYGTPEFAEKIKNLSKQVKNQVGGLSEISVRAGYRVNYIYDQEHRDVYGFYDRDSGAITINLAGENETGVVHHLMVTAGHEMTHWLEQHSKGGYAALRQFVLDRMRANGENIEKRLMSTIDNFNAVMGESGHTLNLSDAMSEIVANACDQVLGSQEVANELAKTNPSLFNKIKTFVKNFVARIRAAAAGMNLSASRESGLLMKDVEQLAKIWLGAREEALGNGNTTTINETSKELQFSYKTMSGLSWEQQVRRILDNNASKNDMLVINDMQGLNKIGIDKPLTIRQSVLSKGMKIREEGKSASAHNLTHKIVMRLKDKLLNPVAIITKGDTIYLVTDLKDLDNDNIVLVSKRINEYTKGGVYDAKTVGGRKNISTLFGKFDPETGEFIADTTAKIFRYKENANDILSLSPVQFGAGADVLDAIEMLSQDRNKVKQLSVRQQDNAYDDQGNPIDLSERFSDKTDIRYSVKQKGIDQRQQELSQAWQTARDEANELREQLRSMKPEMDAWVDRITEADKAGNMDEVMAEYKEWEKGYTELSNKLQAAEQRYKKANQEFDDYIEQRDIAEEQEKIKKSGLSEPEYRRKQAVNEFGYTTDFREAGYLLPNGKMLNFTGEKGKHYGTRGEDHRGIGRIYASSQYQGGAAMMAFMRDGNIRVMAETPGVDIVASAEPTREQYAAIRNMARRFAGEEYFNVDFTDDNGYNVDSIEYDGHVNPDRVINDIKYFFKTGKVQGQSIVSQFHYSISTRMNDSVDYEAIQYAIAQENMDVNRWMLGLNEKTLNTEQERALLKQFKNLRFDVDVNQMAMDDYRAELRKLEAKENPSVYDREKIRKIRNQMEVRQAKLDRLNAQIAQVTSSEGYAGLMYKQQKLMNELVNGRTAEEVRTTADAISKELSRISSEMDERAARLEELAKTEGVVSAKAYFAKSGLKKMAAQLKKEMNSSMANKDIESRLALMALKLRQGNDVTDDVGELANLLMERRKDSAESYILSELRGRTLVLSEAMVKELKARNLTVREAQQELKGSGIRLKTGKTDTLDMVWEDLCDLIPSLDREATDLQMLDELTRVVKSELSTVQQSGWEGEAGKVANMVLGNVIELVDKAEKIDSTSKEMIDYIRSVAGEAAETAQYIKDLTAAVERMKKRTAETKKTVGALDKNVGKAIDYFNALTEQSEAAIWRSERAKLIEQMKSESTEALLAEQAKWKERIEKDKNAREMAAKNANLRREINTVASRVKTRLLNETDQKNIPEEAKGLARKLLSMLVTHDTIAERKVLNADKKALEDTEQRLKKMEALYGTFEPETDLDWLVIKTADPADSDYTMRDKVWQDLVDIETGLMEYRNAKGSRAVTLRDINSALTKVQEAVSEIWSTIRARSEADIAGRKYMVYELAEQLEADMAGSKFKGERTGKLGRAANSAWKMIGYGNTTPEYFIKNLKNGTMSLLYSGLQEAENRSGLEAQRAQDRIAQIAEETGYANWDGQKKQTIRTATGREIEISTEQLMALYATWIREKNQLRPEETAHLLKGGFVLAEDNSKGIYGRKKSSMRPIRLSKAELDSLGDHLTEQQKEYVNQIVEYMSTDMAELGNEASMKAYGIKKFTEKYYFPIRSWGGVLNKNSAAGTVNTNENRAMQQSFSKRLTNNAQNAIEITDFTPTAMKHIVGMITFNTVGPAVENINKVMNQQLEYLEEETHDRMPDMENDITYKRNMRAAFQEAYGKNARDYLEQLMKDVNGGVASGNGSNVYDRLLSAFKKNAVAGSLSVAAQQPLSYIRAATMINPKYLAQAILPTNWKKVSEEMMKYSGIAVIKQMGKFDMNYGRSMVDYITPEGMETKRQKAGRIISDAATSLPGKMDELTWGRMWQACKLEQAAMNPGVDQTSEKFLKQVAARFNELMRRTQVYDSVLVKSENMRNQHPFAKTITSFMAEPTLSINVLADAWMNIKEKGGKLNAVKALATFMMSAAMQAAVKAFFSAGRTPDKKKNREENYLYRLTYNLMNEANPLGLIPGYSNIIDVLKNGELTDNSMSVIAKAKDALTNLNKLIVGGDEMNWYRTVEDSVGQLLQIATNVPAKNMMRDFRAMVNFFSNGDAKGLTGQTYAQRETSNAVLKYQAIDLLATEDLIGLVNKDLGVKGYQTSNNAYFKRIYDAQKAGKTREAQEMSEYMTTVKITAADPAKELQTKLNALAKTDDSLSAEEKIEQLSDGGYGKMGQYIIDQYKRGEITRAKAEELYRKENQKATKKDVLKALDKAEWEKEGKALAKGDKEYTNYTPLKIGMEKNSAADIDKAVKYMMKNEFTAKDIRTQVNKWVKERYAEADSNEKVKLRDAMHKAYKALGFKAEDADKVINKWKPKKESGTAEIVQPRMKASAGVSDVGYSRGKTASKPQRPKSDSDWGKYMDDLDEYWAGYDFNRNDPTGRYGKGTIDLNNRIVMHNADGSISSERSFSFEDEDTGKEILIPLIVNGKVLTEDEAIDHYYETVRRGKPEYLGIFNNWKDADEYATMLHNRQNWYEHR